MKVSCAIDYPDYWGHMIRKWNVCLSCYLATCTLVTQVTSGTFTSPSYPSEYANYLDLCVAYIVGPPGSNITIDFFIFNVEYESSCGYDYLLVRSHCKSHEISAVMLKVVSAHWGRYKTDVVLQTTFSNAFSWMKTLEFNIRFHWNMYVSCNWH